MAKKNEVAEYKCPECGTDNMVKNDKFSKNVRFFCGQCGCFLQKDKLNNRKAAELPELKLARIIENLNYLPHSKILWDDMADRYATMVEKYKALYELDDIKNEHRADLSEKMKILLEKCRNSDFTIAFVGTIKTGKSTLINALLGRNYASMDVTPETAALTKFRSSRQDYVRVSFYNQQEFDEMMASVSQDAEIFKREYEELEADKQKKKWIGHEQVYKELANSEIEQELKTWSSSKKAEHYFVKEIEVGISSLGEDFPEQVVFVDTPGLSDPVAYRSAISRKYIKRASAVFVCVEAQKMHQEEIETLSSVFSFAHNDKGKVHVIATHWDALNHPIEDWEKQREYMLRLLTERAYFADRETAESNILHSSAYIYNLCRDFSSLTKEEKRPLKKFAYNFDDEEIEKEHNIDVDEIETRLEFFKQLSNIENIKETIKEHLVSRYREVLQADIEHLYQDIMHGLKNAVRENRKQYQENIAAAQSGKQALAEKIEQQKEAVLEIKKNGELLEAVMDNVRESTERRLEEIISAIDNKKPEKKPKPKKPKKKRGLFDVISDVISG